MQDALIIQHKDERFADSGYSYSVGYCTDRLGYVYQSGIICGRLVADFRLNEEIVGYMYTSDYSHLGVAISSDLYGAFCSLVHNGLHKELFTIVDDIYKQTRAALRQSDP